MTCVELTADEKNFFSMKRKNEFLFFVQRNYDKIFNRSMLYYGETSDLDCRIDPLSISIFNNEYHYLSLHATLTILIYKKNSEC
jgi:hypothetical protein